MDEALLWEISKKREIRDYLMPLFLIALNINNKRNPSNINKEVP